jgi:hypothetical protein
MSGQYIALVTSLPHLPYFERATRLPITERALRQRLRTLNEHDYAQLLGAVLLLRWKHHPTSQSSEEVERQYRAFMARSTNAALRDFVDWCIGSRNAMAAVRLKADLGSAAPAKAWGAGSLVRLVERNWSKPEVGMNARYPWLQQARQFLASGTASSLARLEMSAMWRRLSSFAEVDLFGFEFVAAYAFKWDIVNHWLGYDNHKAREKFKKLTEEAISGYQCVGA